MKFMEQHPLPQDIAAYKFRLVGSMTLKQFLELAGGVVIAWLIFSSGFNFLIKWTLAPAIAFFGFALAFIPFEDRPLDQWILNFFKAIYQPTQFVYHPEPKQPEFMESVKIMPRMAKDSAQPLNPAKTIRGVRVRKLLHPQMCLLPHAALYQAPAEPVQASMPHVMQQKPLPASASPQVLQAGAKPIAKPKAQTKPTAVVKPKIVLKPEPVPVSTTPAIAATFAKDLVLPQSPEKPNLIAGITLDEKGKILPSVILEIKDKQGLPVRALKSNKLGQFFIATPLEDGIYQIAAEGAGKRFAIIKLEAKGEIIPPLKIQAQG